MSDDQPSIESAPTPSIQSLKSKFEQLAQENSKSSSSLTPPAATKLGPPGPLIPQPYSRQPQDDHSSSSRLPHRQLRNASSHSDLSSGQKRPPPPPPSRSVKKSTPSPAVSPLLRPVPVPAVLKSPRTSPDRLPAPRLHQDSEDDAPRGGGVASLRERFA